VPLIFAVDSVMVDGDVDIASIMARSPTKTYVCLYVKLEACSRRSAVAEDGL
jgi:hypothetical protein